jgi:hypothetical protein
MRATRPRKRLSSRSISRANRAPSAATVGARFASRDFSLEHQRRNAEAEGASWGERLGGGVVPGLDTPLLGEAVTDFSYFVKPVQDA